MKGVIFLFKKFTAAVVALSLVVGLGAANTQNSLNVNTACAASTESDSKEVKVDNITYTVYADHAEVKEAIKSISGEVIIPELIALIILLRTDAGRAAQTVEVAAVGQSSTALTSVSSSSKAQSQSSTALTNVSSSSKEQSVDSVEEVSSAAENSTSQKSFTYMKGDVDADGMLTYADLELLKRLVDTDFYIEPQQFYSADMDNNNKIDTVDVAMLKQLLN